MKHMISNISSIITKIGVVMLWLLGVGMHAQQKVKAQIDRDTLKIGEQIQYTITVETDTVSLVQFPEDQTFSPLEMVEALKIDTTTKKDRRTLQRIYALTQFDSGAYTIPPQRIAINEQPFFTDSFKIRVADVLVDTTQQKMYDIKPLINVSRNYGRIVKYVLWILPVLAIIGLAVWWFFIRKKPITEEEKIRLLPPYERAMLKLEELEKSRYLIEDEYKAYYTELTSIIRAYLEEEVHIPAQESTTDQIINRLELLKDSGELQLDNITIEKFREVLQLADLVKFAKNKPETQIAEKDRKTVTELVIKTKEALPHVEEEQPEEDPEYEIKLRRKRIKTKIAWAAGIFIGLILTVLSIAIAIKGFTPVKDTVLRKESKILLEGEWVQSSYGFPPIEIATPQVLLRQKVDEQQLAKDSIQSAHMFEFTAKDNRLKISIVSQLFMEAKNPDMVKFSEEFLKSMEKNGGVNIIAKTEEAFTKSGVEGAKVFGSYKIPLVPGDDPERMKYELLIFGGQGFTQHIFISWDDNDSYLNQIVEKIKSSIDVKSET